MPELRTLLNDLTFPQAELAAMTLDAEVISTAQTWVCSDEPLTSELKAKCLLDECADHFAASGQSSLWVSGLAPEPTKHTLAMLTRYRPTERLLARRVIRDFGELDGRTIPVADYVRLSNLDSLCEVLRDPKIESRMLAHNIDYVSRECPQLLAECHAKLRMSNRLPYSDLALQRLEMLAF